MTHVVVEYFDYDFVNEKEKKERTIEFDMDDHYTDEEDMIEEFYNRIPLYRLDRLKSFFIVNTNKKYELTIENEDKLFCKLYYMVHAERKMSRLEHDLCDTYENYLDFKKDYWYHKKQNKTA